MSANLTITVVVENTANQEGLLGEHGLAFWIERAGRRILFDTGQGMALAHNAEKLNIDLTSVDTVALSHGHYDHSGGLLAALPDLRGATVYAHVTALRERFIQDSRRGARSVGSPIASLDWLTSSVNRVVPMRTRPVELGEGIWLTGQIPRRNDFEDTGGAFYLDQACTQADTIVDDQAVYMPTGQGLVVLLGCAHAGVVNTLDHICTLTGERRVHAVCGGMHLLHADDRRLERTIARLRDLGVERVGLAHCTGFEAMARLYHELPNRCFHCVAGTRITFE